MRTKKIIPSNEGGRRQEEERGNTRLAGTSKEGRRREDWPEVVSPLHQVGPLECKSKKKGISEMMD